MSSIACFVRLGSWVGFVQSADNGLTANSKRLENFLEQGHRFSIKGESKIYTACDDGKIPFVSTKDIANVVFRALTDEKPHNTEYRVLGPELLTYNQVYPLLN